MSPITRPTRDQVLVFPDREALRAWFEDHHATVPEAFIGYYRRGVGKVSTTWEEAVEEALCVGWIDGITFRVDDEVTANRFTPRRKGSNWSAVNIAKVAELRAAGRMRPAGIRAFEERDRRKDASYSYERPEAVLPAEWLDAFRADADAWAFWERQTPSYRRTATHWVTSAAREETRRRRFATLVADSRAGRRPRPFEVTADRAR
jgi:uncharacterized protein YdeI (YjbR/CyaY-like superfamily)